MTHKYYHLNQVKELRVALAEDDYFLRPTLKEGAVETQKEDLKGLMNNYIAVFRSGNALPIGFKGEIYVDSQRYHLEDVVEYFESTFAENRSKSEN